MYHLRIMIYSPLQFLLRSPEIIIMYIYRAPYHTQCSMLMVRCKKNNGQLTVIFMQVVHKLMTGNLRKLYRTLMNIQSAGFDQVASYS